MQVSLDRQTLAHECPDCGETFTVVRGSAYGDREPIGLYLIALHGHDPSGRLAHLAVAVLDRSTSEPTPYAVAMLVSASSTQFGYSVVDWSQSPWRDEAYLGAMLDRESALSNPHKELFFHIAEHVVRELPEVQDYFS
jgi:hypothetical protein